MSEITGIVPVGFFDPGAPRASELPRCATVKELLSVVDAVLISVPPARAPQYVCLALEAKVHVFCEKPAAINVKELSPVGSLLESCDRVLAYGFNHRQHQSILRIHELLRNEVLGSVLWMRGRYGKEVDRSYRRSWRCNPSLNGGGILIDQGIHMIDLMNHLSGPFDGAQAVLSNSYLGIDGVEDNAFITLFSKQKRIAASVHSTITQWRYLFSLEIFLEKGSIVLNGLRTNSGSYGDEILTIKPNVEHENSIQHEILTYDTNESWTSELRAFFKAVANQTRYPFADYQDALQTTTIIDQIYERAEWI